METELYINRSLWISFKNKLVPRNKTFLVSGEFKAEHASKFLTEAERLLPAASKAEAVSHELNNMKQLRGVVRERCQDYVKSAFVEGAKLVGMKYRDEGGNLVVCKSMDDIALGWSQDGCWANCRKVMEITILQFERRQGVKMIIERMVMSDLCMAYHDELYVTMGVPLEKGAGVASDKQCNGSVGTFVTEAFDYARRSVNRLAEKTHGLKIGVKRGNGEQRAGKRKKGEHDLSLIKRKEERGWMPVENMKFICQSGPENKYDGTLIEFDESKRSKVYGTIEISCSGQDPVDDNHEPSLVGPESLSTSDPTLDKFDDLLDQGLLTNEDLSGMLLDGRNDGFCDLGCDEASTSTFQDVEELQTLQSGDDQNQRGHRVSLDSHDHFDSSETVDTFDGEDWCTTTEVPLGDGKTMTGAGVPIVPATNSEKTSTERTKTWEIAARRVGKTLAHSELNNPVIARKFAEMKSQIAQLKKGREAITDEQLASKAGKALLAKDKKRKHATTMTTSKRKTQKLCKKKPNAGSRLRRRNPWSDDDDSISSASIGGKGEVCERGEDDIDGKCVAVGVKKTLKEIGVESDTETDVSLSGDLDTEDDDDEDSFIEKVLDVRVVNSGDKTSCVVRFEWNSGKMEDTDLENILVDASDVFEEYLQRNNEAKDTTMRFLQNDKTSRSRLKRKKGAAWLLSMLSSREAEKENVKKRKREEEKEVAPVLCSRGLTDNATEVESTSKCCHDEYVEHIGYKREDNAAYWSGEMEGTSCALCGVEMVDNRKDARADGMFFPCGGSPAFICVNRLAAGYLCKHVVCNPCWCEKAKCVSIGRPKRKRSS